MKTRHIIAALLLTLTTACDKIDDDEYVVFAGAVGEWYDDNSDIDPTQRVMIEKYTGVRCRNCPTADEVIHDALQQYGSRIVALAVHPKGSNYTIPYTGDPDLSCEDGKTWNDALGFNSYPQALLNRNGEAFVPTTNFDSHIDATLAAAPQVGVAVECSRNSDNDELSITAHLSFLTQVAADLNLTLVISEDDIVTSQMMPDGSTNDHYVQNHVLRDVITDVWGTTIDKGEGNGAAGKSRKALFTYQPDPAWDLDRCHIVAFVSRQSDNSILNVAETIISQ